MGGGDLWLLAMIGTFLGLKDTILTFFIAPMLGAPVGLALKLKGEVEYIAYGPYLAVASMISFFWGDQILHHFGLS